MTMINVTAEMLEWCLPSDAVKWFVNNKCKSMKMKLDGNFTELTIKVNVHKFAKSVIMNCVRFSYLSRNCWEKVEYDGPDLIFWRDNMENYSIFTIPFNPLPDGRTEATREEVEGW